MSATLIDAAHPLARLVQQFEASQWASPVGLAASQQRHLVTLAEYSARHSRYCARRLEAAGLSAADLGSAEGLARLPVMTRRDLQAAGADLHCRREPKGHGAVRETRTSGSTGEPVVVRRTETSSLFWNALGMRELRWHRRNLAGRLCAIRANVSEYTLLDDWGAPASLFVATGPRLMLPIATDVAQLAAWVADFRPTLLVVYPSTLNALTEHCRRQRMSLPDLEHILTVGETLAPAIRAEAEATFDVAIADCYSSQEFGYIAAQCPDSGLYHVMSESVIAEVLTDDGRVCGEGEIGRVTITDLHNYATPLVRYAIGDFAEVAGPCPCGRGLPTWRRIVGRERNLVVMPDGSRHWPVTGLLRGRDVAPLVQYQVVQEAVDALELRLVVERELTASEEAQLRVLLRASLGAHFTVRISYYANRIPAGPTGKFEEFVSRVVPGEKRGAVRPLECEANSR